MDDDDDAGAVRPEVEAAAYYVIAEALANAGKHAQATAGEVAASVEDGILRSR